MTENRDQDIPPEAKRHYQRPEHYIALLVAIVAGIIVFSYTGDAEPFIAIGSGVGLGTLAWAASYLHLNRGT